MSADRALPRALPGAEAFARPDGSAAGHDTLSDLDAAIDWMVLLRSGEVTAAEQQAFARWRDAQPSHEAAWQQVAGSLDRALTPLRAAARQAPGTLQATQQALLRDEPQAAEARPERRRLLRGALALAALGFGTALLVERLTPVAGLLADLRTGTGERKTFALPDGSSITLNARSSADIVFDGRQRLVRLRGGELIAQVSPDSQRPFVVQTDDGSVRALGTRFLVSRQPDSPDAAARSFALVLEHTVGVRTPQGAQAVLREGESAWFGRDGIDRPASSQVDRAAWQSGMLVVRDRPLSEVIESLRPYRRGVIRLSPRAARVRVLGAFALGDTDATLQALSDTLPIEITRYQSGWLVSIDAP